MSKKSRAFNIAIIAAIIMLTTSGCMFSFRSFSPDDYHGDYPELYSAAINSILGSSGYAHSERDYDSEITVIEEDDYGRTLFLYYENNIVSTYSLVISQKSDDEYTYFYPDYNFISANKNDFQEAEIEELKEKNDWDTEIDTDKCIRAIIVRKKGEGPVEIDTIMEFYKWALRGDAYSFKTSIQFFTMDDYSRSMYFGYGVHSSNRQVVMLFNPDGSYDQYEGVMELRDKYNYQEQLEAFKDKNGWNQPYE